MTKQSILEVLTRGRATIEITAQIDQLIADAGIETGLCHVFIQHTSASLIVTENADSDVRRDLEYFMSKWVCDGDPGYFHCQEGPDDMSAHIRSILTQTELTIPISAGRLALGNWQGIYLWEHRVTPHKRKLVITVS